MSKRVLLLTLTAGGGHIQAAKAKRQELSDATVFERDLFYDWVGRWFGYIVKQAWGRAQTKGYVSVLIHLSAGASLCNRIFFLPFFFCALYTCLRYKIDVVIDTQPIGTSAIIKALRLVRYLTGKTILLEKVLTDLPTKDTHHFFSGLKQLSKQDYPFLSVHTQAPLLEDVSNDQTFWDHYTHLPLSSIHYTTPPLRPAFFQEHPPLTSFSLHLTSKGDLHTIHNILSFSSLSIQRTKDCLLIPIPPQAHVTTLMLGSNPNPSVILSYLNLFLSNTYHSPHILFLFCNSQVGTINPLLLLHLLQKHKEYPKHLTIVPTPHQEDQAIAPLLQRTNTMITKSGGLSSMEILTACKGDIFIHEEPKKQNHPGMPLWEKGNARYLAHYKQAQFVTPSTFPLTSLLNTTPSSSCVSGP